MRIFGRERQSLRIKKLRAVRALYADGPGTEEIHIELLTETGEKLALQFHHRSVPALIGELTDAYEAINPPLSRRTNMAAGWDGQGT